MEDKTPEELQEYIEILELALVQATLGSLDPEDHPEISPDLLVEFAYKVYPWEHEMKSAVKSAMIKAGFKN
jgi:hypothetical protein